MLQPITNGNAETKKEWTRRRRGEPYGSRTTVIMGGPAALATDYAHRSGPRLSEPRPRRSPRAVTLNPSGNEIRQNKGLLGTTHKLSLGTPLRSLLSYRVQRVGRPQSPDVGHNRYNYG